MRLCVVILIVTRSCTDKSRVKISTKRWAHTELRGMRLIRWGTVTPAIRPRAVMHCHQQRSTASCNRCDAQGAVVARWREFGLHAHFFLSSGLCGLVPCVTAWSEHVCAVTYRALSAYGSMSSVL